MRRFLGLAGLAVATTLNVAPAPAATFTVTNTNDSGTGSLRWAIEQANASPGPDQILVNHVNPTVLTYRPLTELPRIEANTDLLGGCCFGKKTVVIDGTQMSGTGYAGLRLGNGVTVHGVVVSGFRDGAGGAAGIRMEGANSWLYEAYVGTNAAGTSAAGNDAGVVITGSGNRVGYDFEDDRRRVIVSGNGVGVAIVSAGTANANVIQQAWIGLGANGAALPNTSHGVRIAGGRNTRIGGTDPVLRPIIAFNGGGGVVIEGPGDVGNSIQAIRIHGHGGLAIDLGGDGVTANDAGDADEGPNRGQNHPVIDTVAWNGPSADVTGTLSSRPLDTYRLDFYATAAPDASGHGEADRFLGSLAVTTDAAGTAAFNVGVYGTDAGTRFVSATATDAAGNTSEMSAALPASGTPPAVATVAVNVTTDNLTVGWCMPSRCTLREAIVAANLTPNAAQPTEVHFDIPGPGPHVLALALSPPDFTEPVIVDGYTQPGASPNTNPFGSGLNTVLMVTLGCNPSNSGGLSFTSDSMVRGLAFRGCGLAIDFSGDGNVAEGNFIGVDADGNGGTQSGAGVYVRGSFNRVGGTAPAARNLVSGTAFGINVVPCPCGTSDARANVVQGNLVGTTPDGHGAIGNLLAGISIRGYLGRTARDTLIGGLEPGAGNVISGHACPSSISLCRGIEVESVTGPAFNTMVQGNYIGTDAEGDDPLPNKAGIVISYPGANNNVVGGGEAGARNVISGNTVAGVVLQLETVGNRVERNLIGPSASGTGILGNGFGILVQGNSNVMWANVVRGSGSSGIVVSEGIANQLWRNSIGASGTLGIDLGQDGVTANDPQDQDTGPNDRQNFPAVTAAMPGTTVSGTMQGAPSRELMLEFFASTAAHPSGHGEGERLLGSRTVVTDGSGAAAFTFELSAPVAAGESVSATATDSAGNTSEFGPAAPVVEPPFRGTALSVDAAGNGVLDPGEVAAVTPSWKNSSGAPVLLTGQATALGGPTGLQYTVVDAQAAYGTVPSGAEAACTATLDCYRVQVGLPGGRPQTHVDARMDELLSSGSSRSWPLHLGGSFGDMPPASVYYRFVETLLHRGVTSGCGGSAYCAAAATSRQEMAVFVLTALEGAGYRPLPCAAGFEYFADVPAASPYCRWIQELARRRVVSGCGGGAYCPSAPVSREQMAVFVLGAREGPGYRPPACVSGDELFDDVPASSPFCSWIEELARRDVVAGCAGGLYCPAAPVTREQMAVFLTVTFALRLYGP